MLSNPEKFTRDAQALVAASEAIRGHLQRQIETLSTIGPTISAIFERHKPRLIAPTTLPQKMLVKNINAQNILLERFEPKMAPLPDDYTPNKTILISGVN
jgi:hypothetical protein